MSKNTPPHWHKGNIFSLLSEKLYINLHSKSCQQDCRKGFGVIINLRRNSQLYLKFKRTNKLIINYKFKTRDEKSPYLRSDTFIVKVEAQAMLAGSGTIKTDDDSKVTGGIQAYGFAEEEFIKTTTTTHTWGNAWETVDDNNDGYDFTNF